MLWDLYQQQQIHHAQSNATRAENTARSAKNDLRFIQDRLDFLALACQSMWELMRERTTLTDEDIEAKMQEIDLRDGKEDGRMSSPVFECVSCGRNVSGRHARCLYCGTEFQKQHVFE